MTQNVLIYFSRVFCTLKNPLCISLNYYFFSITDRFENLPKVKSFLKCPKFHQPYFPPFAKWGNGIDNPITFKVKELQWTFIISVSGFKTVFLPVNRSLKLWLVQFLNQFINQDPMDCTRWLQSNSTSWLDFV